MKIKEQTRKLAQAAQNTVLRLQDETYEVSSKHV
ncbi:chlorohydrolase [Streptococcus pneumoniae]|nr:chlorohydrolase [Streptococcus pneumoniae]